jgi:hypothetical protein
MLCSPSMGKIAHITGSESGGDALVFSLYGASAAAHMYQGCVAM